MVKRSFLRALGTNGLILLCFTNFEQSVAASSEGHNFWGCCASHAGTCCQWPHPCASSAPLPPPFTAPAVPCCPLPPPGVSSHSLEPLWPPAIPWGRPLHGRHNRWHCGHRRHQQFQQNGGRNFQQHSSSPPYNR